MNKSNFIGYGLIALGIIGGSLLVIGFIMEIKDLKFIGVVLALVMMLLVIIIDLFDKKTPLQSFQKVED